MGNKTSTKKKEETKQSSINSSDDEFDVNKYPFPQTVVSTPPAKPADNRTRTRTRTRSSPKPKVSKTNTKQHPSDSEPSDDDKYSEDFTPIQIRIRPIPLERDTFNPFITDVQIYNNNNNQDNIDDEKTPQNRKDQRRKPHIAFGSFEFGELFDYWDPHSSTNIYVPAEYQSLEEEVTNTKNQVYINKATFNELKNKAHQLSSKMYGAKDSEYAIYAKNKPYFNKLFNIKPDSKMSIDHILSIILYTDTNDLQRYFKEQTRKTHHTEDMDSIVSKNKKYANWFRLLFECVWIFGDELKYNRVVYHGITCKLLFDKFQYDFKAPLSTTFDENVATNFCKGNGIILELRNAESLPQFYFAVQNFSKYSESEYLFFGATLKITSMLIPDTDDSRFLDCWKQIEVLNFYMNIMNGSNIQRYASTHSKNDKDHIRKLKLLCRKTLKFVNKHMDMLKGADVSDVAEDYIWKLFINFTKTNVIWMNKKELLYLKELKGVKNEDNITLIDTLVGDDGGIGEYLRLLLSQNTSMKVLFTEEYEWIVEKDDLDALKEGNMATKNGIVCKDYWDYYIDGDEDKMCTFGGNMIAGYHDEDNKQDNETKKVGFYWRLSDIPDEYKSVMVSVQLYCPQIEFYIQFFNIKMSRSNETLHTLQNTGHTGLFPLSKLNDLDTFQWTVIIKCTPVL